MRKLSTYGPSLVVLLTAGMVLAFGPATVRTLAFRQTEARMLLARDRLDGAGVLEQINQANRDIAAFVEPSVVHVSAEQELPGMGGRRSLSTGSGWIYDADGHIVTNYHVVADVERIDVQLVSGEIRPAEVVGYDASTDIAVLRIPPGLLHPATLASPNEPVGQGDLVYAFGSPFDFRFSMSSGIVSGKGRFASVIRDQSGRGGYESFIQVDAAINPGNSGGPLTDIKGRVIGMNTAIATGRQSPLDQGQFAGIGLAIPLSMIKPVVEQIIEKGFVEKGYLGVQVDSLDPERAAALGFAGRGALVMSVEPDGPAARDGLQAGDVILRVNGESIDGRPQLQAAISSLRPGAAAALEVWRAAPEGGSMQQLTVVLDRLDPLYVRGELPPNQSREHIRRVGIARMATLTPERAQELGITFRRGVVIEATVPGSALEQRMPPGSVVVSVMDAPVRDVDAFIEQLRRYDLRTAWRAPRIEFVRPDGSVDQERLRIDS